MKSFYSVPKTKENLYNLKDLYVAKFDSIMGTHGYGIFYHIPVDGLYKFKRVSTGKYYSEFTAFSDSIVSELKPLKDFYKGKDLPLTFTKRDVALLEKNVQKQFKNAGLER